jgi:hypothetical protein
VLVRPDSARPDTTQPPVTAAQADTAVQADTTVATADTAAQPAADSARSRSKPAAALWRSLLIPGWGQVRLGRKLTAGVFVLAEGVTLGMALRANSELRYLRRIRADSATVNAQSRTREDWLVLMAVNHLLAGLEAFIAANLTDFPPELRIRRGPGWVGASVSLPVRLP